MLNVHLTAPHESFIVPDLRILLFGYRYLGCLSVIKLNRSFPLIERRVGLEFVMFELEKRDKDRRACSAAQVNLTSNRFIGS